MRIIGLLVCGPNERYLEETLKEFERLTDDVLIATNNADKATIELIDSYGFNHYEDNREWGKFQPKIKSDLLRAIGDNLQPDWVLPLDADEVFDPRMGREDLEQLAGLGGVGYYFYIVNLWNKPDRYAKGLSFWNIRFFRYAPEYGLDYLNKPVHCGLAPPIAYEWGNYAPFIVKHYGLMRPEARKNKVARYEKYDPHAQYKSDIYYNALSSSAKGTPLDIDDLRAKVEEEVINYRMKGIPARKARECVVIVTRPDGSSFDVVSKDAERDKLRYERQGNTVVEAEEPSEKVVEVVEEVKEVNLTCDVCGYDADTSIALFIHKRSCAQKE